MPSIIISGTVRDNDGAFIQDAEVTACAEHRCKRGDTDQSGAYDLTVLAGTYTVRATKSGYPNTPDRLVIVPPSQDGINLTFPPWYTIRGTVRHNDGTPVKDATVSTLEGGTPAVKTSADGTYTLTVAAGSYRVRVDKVGYPDYPYLPTRQVTVPPSQTGVDFTFAVFHTVSGTVSEFDGTPVEGVEVGTLWYSDPVYIYEYTDAQGQYVLGLPPGSYSVRAYRSGYVNPPEQRVTVPPSLSGVDIKFVQHFTATGSVRDHDDAAVPFASVKSTTQAETDSVGQYALHLPAGLHCVSVTRSDWPAPPSQALLVPPPQADVNFSFPQRFAISGIVYEQNGTPASGVRVRATIGPTATSKTTGSDGRYSLTVAPGAYTLVVEQDGRVIPDTRAIMVPPDQSGVDFYLTATYPLAGIVRDVHGSSLSGATVCASGASRSCISTGSDGRYRFLIPAGRWAVYAYVSGGTSSYGRSWDVPPAPLDVDFALPWDPRTYTISGSVRDSAGSPLGKIAVRTDTCYGQSATTATDGRFTFSGVPVGIHLVHTGIERRLAVVPPNATGIDFTYPVMYTITGIARDAEGVSLANARVQASVDGQDSSSAYTDADGRYVLSLLSGSYQVRATLSGYAAPLPRSVVVPPSQANVDFDFPAGYRIIGIVRDTIGQPISNAVVRVTGAAGEASMYTSICGAYSLVMAAGQYTVTASRSGYDAPPVQTISLPPERLWLNFVLQSSVSADQRATISGEVRDHDGSPVVGATVTAIGANGSATVNTDDSGAFHIRVPPGAYRVSVVKASLPPPPEQIVAVPPDQTNINFTFPVRHIVRGVVRTSDGQPLESAGVSAEPLACEQSTVYTNTDMSGAYTLTLAAGSYDVSASFGRFAATTRQRLTVPSAESVEFTVRFPLPQYTVRGAVREEAGTPLVGFLVSAGACGLPGASTTTAIQGCSVLTASCNL